MKIALIGASGFVGTAILKELIYRGHVVTAIVKETQAITQNAGIVLLEGSVLPTYANVMNVSEVTDAVKGQDLTISAFNAGWSNPDLYNDFMLGSLAIQQGVKAAGVHRLIVSGGAGSLFLPNGIQVVDDPDFPIAFKEGASAARDYLNILKNEQRLDWTFVSPALEMNPSTSGKRTGVYRTALDTPVYDHKGKSAISVEDLAVAITDEAEQPRHTRERFTVAY